MSAPRQAIAKESGAPPDSATPCAADAPNEETLGLDPDHPASLAWLAQRIESVIGDAFPRLRPIWIAGEITGLRRASGGRLWFGLHEGERHIECVWWAPPRQMAASLQDGVQVVIKAAPVVFTRRVSLVCSVRDVRPAGQGTSARALEHVRDRLRAAGLFEPARKRDLPRVPRAIAVITARDSAAWYDVVTIARQRHPGIPIVFVPAQMQGATAPASIRAALQQVDRCRFLDAVIVTRGGGAAADLEVYNDEALARAIAACRVPVVTAIGHETDYSIADAVADHRAPTPTAAATLVVPDRRALGEELQRGRGAMDAAMRQRLQREAARVDGARTLIAGAVLRRVERARPRLDRVCVALDAGVRHRLHRGRTRIDSTRDAIDRVVAGRLERAGRRLTAVASALERGAERIVQQQRGRVDRIPPMLAHAITLLLARDRARHERVAAQLAALDPLSILRRGYAVVRDADNRVLTSALVLDADQEIRVQYHDGHAVARVTRVARALPEGPHATSEDSDHA